MTLRRRLYVLYIGVFTLVLFGALISIFFIYREYRAEVFYEQLHSRILMTTRLLFEMQTKDQHLMDLLDEQTIHAMFDEKVLIFDDTGKVIYSSIDDASISYSPEILKRIERDGEWRSVESDKEVLGLHYHHEGKDYVALASATDVTGLRMIDHLATALGISFAAGITLMLITSKWFVSRSLRPISDLSADVKRIGPHDLHRRLTVPEGSDEIASISVAFNETLSRLVTAFEFQSNFVHYASHELNTPISVVQAIVERVRNGPMDLDAYQSALNEISAVNERLTDLLTSLLLLAGLDVMNPLRTMTYVRIDDVLFDVAEVIAITDQEVHFSIDLDVAEDCMYPFEVNGVAPLLKTAISNLIENGVKYTTNATVRCKLFSDNKFVTLRISTDGLAIPESYRGIIFQPFVRFTPSSEIEGKGLGLAIVSRIADVHHGSVGYAYSNEEGNMFEFTLPARTADRS